MQTIATITATDIEEVPHRDLWSTLKSRFAARAILTDEAGRIAIMHVSKMGYYKLPGGGIDEGETVSEALLRELHEEAGADQVEVISEIGKTIEYREDVAMKGICYCFLVRTLAPLGPTEPTQKEIDHGYKVTWADDIDHAIELVESGEPQAYGHKFERARELAILKYAKVTNRYFDIHR